MWSFSRRGQTIRSLEPLQYHPQPAEANQPAGSKEYTKRRRKGWARPALLSALPGRRLCPFCLGLGRMLADQHLPDALLRQRHHFQLVITEPNHIPHARPAAKFFDYVAADGIDIADVLIEQTKLF